MKTRWLFLAVLAFAFSVVIPTVFAAPANDNLASATSLDEGVEVAFDNIDATEQGGEDLCADGGGASHGATVWFTFTAPGAGDYAAYTTGSNFDSQVSFASALGTITGACNGDAADSVDAADDWVAFSNGEQEYVQVSSFDEDFQGHGSVGVTEVFDAEDTFASADDLTIRSGAESAVRGLKFDGTEGQQGSEPDQCGSETMTGGTAWLDFSPPTSGSWMIEAKANERLSLAVYSGNSLGSLTLINCAVADNPSEPGRIAPIVPMTAGVTYRIQIFDTGGLSTSDSVIVRAEPTPSRLFAAEVAERGGPGAAVTLIDDYPGIVFYNEINMDLRFLHQQEGGTWTNELIDHNGNGNSTDVGRNPSIATVDGLPQVTYYDATAGALRVAGRDGNGSWTDKQVDTDGDGTSTDVGRYSSVADLDGIPIIAYEDGTAGAVRYAQQDNLIWLETHIETTDPFNADVSSSPTAAVVNGNPVITYTDYTNNTLLRYAERIDDVWSITTIYDTGVADVEMRSSMAVGIDGIPRVAAALPDGRHVLFTKSGASWTMDVISADNRQAEVDTHHAPPELLLNDNDVPLIVWYDGRYGGTLGITVKSGNTWSTQAAFPFLDSPTSSDWPGRPDVDVTKIGAGWVKNGSLGLAFGTSDNRLWFATDALTVDLGGNIIPSAVDYDFDASDSGSSWPSPLTAEWGPAPEGCTVSFSGTYTGTIRCVGPTPQKLTLTISDETGLSATDGYTISNAVCPTGPDPFTDSDGVFHDDINCIFNIGVTTGATLTTYDPGGFVTRQQMALFMARLYASITGAEAPIVATPFTDMPTGAAADAIARIFGLGITTGDTATTYNPTGNVTRRQMALFMARLYDVIRPNPAPVVETPFTDVTFGGEAADAIGKIFGLEITLGATETTYEPNGFVTRGQMGAFLARLFTAD